MQRGIFRLFVRRPLTHEALPNNVKITITRSVHIDPVLPSNHGYYAMSNQFGWKNLKNCRWDYDGVGWAKVKFRMDVVGST